LLCAPFHYGELLTGSVYVEFSAGVTGSQDLSSTMIFPLRDDGWEDEEPIRFVVSGTLNHKKQLEVALDYTSEEVIPGEYFLLETPYETWELGFVTWDWSEKDEASVELSYDAHGTELNSNLSLDLYHPALVEVLVGDMEPVITSVDGYQTNFRIPGPGYIEIGPDGELKLGDYGGGCSYLESKESTTGQVESTSPSWMTLVGEDEVFEFDRAAQTTVYSTFEGAPASWEELGRGDRVTVYWWVSDRRKEALCVVPMQP
jgi:hypothetical protein